MEKQDTRYNRQELMPEWGIEGQKKLSSGKVSVIGAGGVKSVLLYDLAAAGVGEINIYEFDTIELSNLNRQILYSTADIGKFKGDVAKEKLSLLNPDIKIGWINEKIDSTNINSLLGDSEFIVEGGDSPFARNLINEFCLKNSIPYAHASAQFSYGYVFSVLPQEKTACFACFFPNDYTRKEHTGAVPVTH